MAHDEGLVGIFSYVDDLLSALERLKRGGYRIENVYSPLHLPEVADVIGKKPSVVRLITLLGGICGGLGMIGLAVYAHLSFGLITSGKPVLPWVPWVIVCFEGTILGAVLSSMVAWVVKGGMPRLRSVPGYDPVFSQDRFGILVACTGSEQEQVRTLLKEAGAGEVRHAAW